MEVIELFSGIGATSMALKDLEIDFEVIGVSEKDNVKMDMYNRIHGATKNFGDITKIKELPQCDFLHASSPCVSFSRNGKKDGLKGESKLLKEVLRLLQNYYDRGEVPSYFSFENVCELLTKFPEIFNSFKEFLETIGYNVYYNCLNAAYFDNPQKRERLFIIGIRKDIDKGNFSLNLTSGRTIIRMKDLLIDESEVDPKFIHSQFHYENRHKRVRPIPKDTFKTIEDGYYYTENSTARCQSNRLYNPEGLFPTLTTVPFINILKDGYIRKAVPLEYWRAMGFRDEDFEKVKEFSTTALIKAAGDSICLGPLKAIYRQLFESQGVLP